MTTLVRNPSFMRQALLLASLAAIGALASLLLVDGAFPDAGRASLMRLSPGGLAAAAVMAVGMVLVVAFSVISHRRYAEIARLASEIDDMLHGQRAVQLSDYREGDVAMLRNEVGKVCARLAKTAEDLAAEKASLSQALADISHQIRTPLTAAELMIPVISRTEDERERARKLGELEVILDRISWLVTSLLKIARVDAGAVRISSDEHGIAEAVFEAVRPLEIAMDMRGIACAIDVDRDARFRGDPAWTAEAIANILKNCMEHTPYGGAISVEAREDAVACRVVVQDGGAGISPEDMPHIFERFYRGAPPERAAAQAPFDEAMRPAGFGIGLSLAKALINAQGGTVRASNAPHGGARFEIAFPKVTV